MMVARSAIPAQGRPADSSTQVKEPADGAERHVLQPLHDGGGGISPTLVTHSSRRSPHAPTFGLGSG